MQKNKTVEGQLAASAVVVMFGTSDVQARTQAAALLGGNTDLTVLKGKLSAGDEKALKDMAQANINEVFAAIIALKRAQNPEVKKFAQKMVDDHGSALTKVKSIAQQKGVALPAEPDVKHKSMSGNL